MPASEPSIPPFLCSWSPCLSRQAPGSKSDENNEPCNDVRINPIHNKKHQQAICSQCFILRLCARLHAVERHCPEWYWR